MENSFQTSFIPKKPVTETTLGSSGRSSTDIFTVIAVAVLLIVGAIAGGLFLYKNYLISEKQALSTSIGKIRDSFDKDTISELELFDKRSSSSKTILNDHLVLSPMFSLLNTLTIPAIQYTKFDHQTTDKGFDVSMSGIARDYRSVALQADVFNGAKGRSFKNVIFSNLTLNKDGNVTFDLEFTVDPSLLSYEQNLLLEQAQAQTQVNQQIQLQQPQVQATSPTTQNKNSNVVIPVTSGVTQPQQTVNTVTNNQQ
jgi:hypothetical protein